MIASFNLIVLFVEISFMVVLSTLLLLSVSLSAIISLLFPLLGWKLTLA
jgi:hypothetical protein